MVSEGGPGSVPSSKTNALNVSQKMIEMFVRTKHKIHKSHEFALVVVNDDMAWVRESRRERGLRVWASW